MDTLATHMALLEYLRAAENLSEAKKGANIAELRDTLRAKQRAYWSALDAED